MKKNTKIEVVKKANIPIGSVFYFDRETKKYYFGQWPHGPVTSYVRVLKNKCKIKKSISNEIFQSLLVKEEGKPKWKEKVEFRRENKTWLKLSVKVALKILNSLQKKKISFEEFKKLIEIEENDQAHMILQGSYNFDLKMLTKIEKVLGIKLLEINEE